MLTGNAHDHLLQVLDKIRNNEHFGLIRPSDGEYLVMTNHTLTNIDNWTYTAGDILREQLINAVKISRPNLYIGIQCNTCPYCCVKIHNDTMNNYITCDTSQITYAAIFCNGNWKEFIDFLKKYEKGIYAITPGTMETSEINVKDRYVIDKFLVNNWNELCDQETNNILNFIKDKQNELICFSAGPLSKILIPKCMEINPDNIYLDVGSTLDVFLKGYQYKRSYVDDGCVYNFSFCNNNFT
jgi:hypothetical protein